MNNAMFQEIVKRDLAEKFWNELNSMSTIDVPFVDAAVCFTILRQMNHGDFSMEIAQA